MPINDPYPVTGLVKDENGQALDSATVSVYNSRSEESISATTNASGEYSIDLGNLTDGYENQDVCFMKVSTNSPKRWSPEFKFIIDTSVGYFEQNVVAYFVVDRTMEEHPKDVFQKSFDPVAGAVKIVNVDEKGNASSYTQALAYTSSNLVEYQGEAKPGTKTSERGWRIKKLTYSGNYVTNIEWAEGDSSFAHIWDDRASYNYS